MPWFYALCLSVALAWSLHHVLDRHARLRHARSPATLTLTENRVTLLQRDGRSFEYQLLPATTLGIALFVLQLVDAHGKTRRELLHADMMPADCSRRLRAWLALHRG